MTATRGSILGGFTLRDELHLKTGNGSMNVEIEEKAASAKHSRFIHAARIPGNLSRTTDHGDQKIKIYQNFADYRDMIWFNDSYPFLMHAIHRSASGCISLESGPFWEGTADATSINGSVEISGNVTDRLPAAVDDVSFGKRTQRARARKHRELSSIIVSTEEGDVDILLGGPMFGLWGKSRPIWPRASDK